MILFRYTKMDGAEYIPHLDTLRHIIRTLIRGKIDVKKSEGYNKHPKIFMSAPIGVGIKSKAEYCCVDTDCDITAIEFKEKFNQFSPKGIKCVESAVVQSNPNVAGCITSCEYKITNIGKIDIKSVLDSQEFYIIDKNEKRVNVRSRILSARLEGKDVYCVLKTGNENLRPDYFAKSLNPNFMGEIIKIQAFGLDNFNFV